MTRMISVFGTKVIEDHLLGEDVSNIIKPNELYVLIEHVSTVSNLFKYLDDLEIIKSMYKRMLEKGIENLPTNVGICSTIYSFLAHYKSFDNKTLIKRLSKEATLTWLNDRNIPVNDITTNYPIEQSSLRYQYNRDNESIWKGVYGELRVELIKQNIETIDSEISVTLKLIERYRGESKIISNPLRREQPIFSETKIDQKGSLAITVTNGVRLKKLYIKQAGDIISVDEENVQKLIDILIAFKEKF
jgi:hypothetical protein